MKWLVYQRGTIPLYRADPLLRALFSLSGKLNSVFVETLYINTGPVLEWSWNGRQIRRLGNAIINRCRRPVSLKKHTARLDAYNRKAIRAAEKIVRLSLKSFSRQELVDQYRRCDAVFSPAYGALSSDIDAVELVLEKHVMRAVLRALPPRTPREDAESLVRKLVAPVYRSYVSQRELAILAAVHAGESSARAARKLYQQFWWTNLGWENMRPYPLSFFVRAFERYRNLPSRTLEERLRAERRALRAVAQERRRLMKRHGLGPRVAHWLKMVDQYAYLHDTRKEGQVKMMYAYYALIRETARRLRLRVGDMEWLRNDEVCALLAGGEFDHEEVRRRKQAVAILVTRKNFAIWSGEEAIRVREREIRPPSLLQQDVQGKGVTIGSARGIVRVCRGAQDALQKVRRGDVLVCPMTLPDYVPAMKRAAAIITDEGGVTCHAAIISRELGIPCIVGTKIATQVLKDGDLVEVDADKGIVKVIE